jgi:hypothetical protein
MQVLTISKSKVLIKKQESKHKLLTSLENLQK